MNEPAIALSLTALQRLIGELHELIDALGDALTEAEVTERRKVVYPVVAR